MGHPRGAFRYQLPPELIAQYPRPRPEDDRLLVVHREGGVLEHRRFGDLPALLREGDLLVVNDTRVIPARLRGRKPTGGQVEVLLLHPLGEDGQWCALVRCSRPRPGTRVRIAPELALELVAPQGRGWRVRVEAHGDLRALLERYGQVPLPPYIRRPPEEVDRQRYQTIFARREGSAAAPTAGLHFTPELLERLSRRGVELASVTLHVGGGTFLPLRDEEPQLMPERFEVPAEAVEAVARARGRGARVVAVGTTVVRALESAVGPEGTLRPGRGWTDLFIQPGHRFRCVDALITNFHLPGSSLVSLVCAFGGEELVRRAYQEAIARRYRFYSYGDAMLIL